MAIRKVRGAVKRPIGKDENERQSDVIRTLGRCCLAAFGIFVVWGIVYSPLKTNFRRMHLPAHRMWMINQRNMTNFIMPNNNTIILAPNNFDNQSLSLVVVVCSAIPNFKSRQAIRNTWAKNSSVLENVRIYFLLGISTNTTINSAIVKESQKFSDIIQQNFLDTYNNLTLKSVMLLKWIIHSSVNTEYIMKTDDDMFIHLPNLLKLLKNKKPTKLLIGSVIKGATPIKDWRSKWFVPYVVFPENEYPPYLSGTGYVMSRDLILPLYQTALNTPFFYLEDIFITGICSRRLGIKPENNNGFRFYKRKNDICVFRSLITAHKMNAKELHMMWTKIHNPSFKCKS